MASHTALFQQLISISQRKPFPEPKGALLMIDALTDPSIKALFPGTPESPGPTPNYIAMARVGYLGWAVLHGSGKDVERAKLFVADWLRRRLEIGLWEGEQTCPDPHAQFHLGSEIVLRDMALELRNKDLIEESSQRWQSIMRVYAACSLFDGTVWAPGRRAGQNHAGKYLTIPPHNQCGTVVHMLARNYPLVGVYRKSDWWGSLAYGLGPISRLREMLKSGDDLGLGTLAMRPADRLAYWKSAGTTLPKMKYPLTVDLYENGYEAYLTGGRAGNPERDGQPTCTRVMGIYQYRSGEDLTCSFDWRETGDESVKRTEIFDRLGAYLLPLKSAK